MLKDVNLGRYVETGSVLHKADPRIKIIAFILYLVAIFMVDTYVGLVMAALITVIQLVTARITPRVAFSTLVPITPIALFIFIINIFTIRTGDVIWHYKFITITADGLTKAVTMSARLLIMILSTSVLLTLTITPLKLSDALEKLLGPLKKIKVPVHEMSMMMSIALRFIPTLMDETDKIMKAQVSRGADYDTGSFIKRLKGYITVLVPLFVSSFKRAEDLAIAMDARCYRGGDGRTKLNPLKMTGKDVIIFILLTLGAVLIVVADKLI